MAIMMRVVVFSILCCTTVAAQVFVPPGLEPGDPYHLAFITEGARDAASPDIADYNAFVQAEAGRSGAITEAWGIDWFAIASTEAVAARQNVLLQGNVYLIESGAKASPLDYGLWQGWVDHQININQFGDSQPDTIVWTGSKYGGTPHIFEIYLGGDHDGQTGTNSPPAGGMEWLEKWNGLEPMENEHSFYAVSQLLIDGNPVPFLPGDYDANGSVDQGDLDLVLANWNNPNQPSGEPLRSPPLGWLFDPPVGPVDQAELDSVLLNWGNERIASPPVPEPASVVLMLLAAAVCLTACRRR